MGRCIRLVSGYLFVSVLSYGPGMIRYTLTCAEGHRFESWFQSADAFDTLSGAGMVSCSLCGSCDVTKALMAPALKAGQTEPVKDAKLGAPATEVERAIAELKRRIESESDYVGLRFAEEAREMHDGLIPMRTIHGEARPDEARRLIEDGIPIAPLPFLPARKTN